MPTRPNRKPSVTADSASFQVTLSGRDLALVQAATPSGRQLAYGVKYLLAIAGQAAEIQGRYYETTDALAHAVADIANLVRSLRDQVERAEADRLAWQAEMLKVLSQANANDNEGR